ncbi:hypothetical protein DACRYDRAFT_115900 [Dacryopinax primogenitus]|uniref:Six-hairpin glycosidase n=1 Tax=Dacryopinax primogenitus (strain DJM 731) TaxID=1858805 RepID=M5G029_DACPD|nr:uncharacterized protein DACRYDRAFT_115900 [Dacryopinax primogenitus]EJU02109.1 hypothetical protein DACRYDRAFT_115900 [Dacryopinax primogenitus]
MTSTIVITHLQRAMRAVYGDFSHLSTIQASSWIPPAAAEGHRGRYLWTDAFGVLNFLTLYKETREQRYLSLAARLIATVHDILGRTRDGVSRLPGATEANPVGGGLRIGKEEDTGRDGDGQYHHYLTLWMFALNRMSLASQDQVYNHLAIALAQAIHPAFVHDREASRPRMYWKVSMDLSKPLVSSEGNLDPIDGYVVYTLLQRTDGSDALQAEIDDYRKILHTKWRYYVSDDPLDLGMTLWTAHWLQGEEEWADALVTKAFSCLSSVWDDGYFQLASRHRLAFREFGTCLGIQCHEDTTWQERARSIVAFWEGQGQVPEPPAQQSGGKLTPITCVMYAAALCPGAFRKGYF